MKKKLLLGHEEEVAPTRVNARRPKRVRIVLLLILLLLSTTALALRPDTVRAALEIAGIIELKSEPQVPASPRRLSDYEIEKLDEMPPQAQAELLVERAINHYEGALEWIDRLLESWQGNLTESPAFYRLLGAAINSNDLRVRAAAIEVSLALYNLPKTPEVVEQIIEAARSDPEEYPGQLLLLGYLANRGIQPELARETLLQYIRHPNEEVRYWAVGGLAHIGADETITPLLEVLHDDPSLKVRERAACSLAQSGMLRRDQRLKAVPELLRYMDDPVLDDKTRGWVFRVLSDITGQRLPSEPAAWWNWWASLPSAERQEVVAGLEAVRTPTPR